MSHVTYSEMVDLFGGSAAHDLLRVIERDAAAETNVMPLDRNARLEQALHRMGKQFLAIQQL